MSNRVALAGIEYDVSSASNAGDDSETMEFRFAGTGLGVPFVIGVTQVGDGALTRNLLVHVPHEATYEAILEAVNYVSNRWNLS